MIGTVRKGQSILDVALQYFGSIESIFTVAERLGISITEEAPDGATFEYSVEEVVDLRMVEYYGRNGVVPVSNVVLSPIFDNSFEITFT